MDLIELLNIDFAFTRECKFAITVKYGKIFDDVKNRRNERFIKKN